MAEKTPTIEREDEAQTTEASTPTPAEASNDLLINLRQENEELRTKILYLQAEFENFRKRAGRDTESFLRFAHEALFSGLLPVLDELDAAVAGLDGRTGEGVRMVRDNLSKVLREAGLQEIPAQGLPFDPYVMDCVQQIPDPKAKDGTVKDVARKGYRYRDRTLRPAQVIVVKNGGESNA